MYSQNQIERANMVNLADFLISHGEQLIKSGQEFRWTKHDSLTIRENRWYRHSRNNGGYPISFVMEFMNKSFPEAVYLLTGEEPENTESYFEVNKESGSVYNESFRLPERNADNETVLKYLTEERCLDKDIVLAFVNLGNIYEDAAHHNAVFVGRDKNSIPGYAAMRSTTDKFRIDATGSDKSYGFSYRGSGHNLLVFESPIDMLSFICLFTKDWQTRSFVSLGGVSGKALIHILSEREDIEQVFMCLDNDDAGNEASQKLTEVIPDSIKVTRLVPSRKDWNDVLRDKDNIDNHHYILNTVVLREAKKEEPVTVIRMSEVATQEVRWLWYPYIPFGKITIIQGNPGEGKTTFILRVAAACTTGNPVPGMKSLEPFSVIYQTAEDGLGDTIKPRLIDAEADLSRVFVIDESDRDLTLTDERIEKAVTENGVRLVIIDPIQAYLGSNVDMNRANEIRPVMKKLTDMAERTGCAVILIGHLNKAGGTSSAYRGLGSIDFRAAVRSLLLIGRLKDNPTVRVICHDKSSLAPEGKSIAFKFDEEEGFVWLGEYDISSDDLLNGKSGDEPVNKTEQAREIILEILNSRSMIASDEIDRIAIEKGVSERTVRRVKSDLRNEKILGSKRIGTKWFNFLMNREKENSEPIYAEFRDISNIDTNSSEKTQLVIWPSGQTDRL